MKMNVHWGHIPVLTVVLASIQPAPIVVIVQERGMEGRIVLQVKCRVSVTIY